MVVVHYFTLTFILVSVLQGVLAAGPDLEGDISNVLNEFRQRFESLEARDAAKDARIAEMESEISSLKSKMDEMESTHKQREDTLQQKIDLLEKTIEQATEETEKAYANDDDTDLQKSTRTRPSAIKRERTNLRSRRSNPEVEVAFYATHTDIVVQHLGPDQIIQFKQIETNMGNAFSNVTGAFVAPVAGTYVFHVTLLGIDATEHDHVRAHIDVDGRMYARLNVTPYDQSSQMLVINLRAGQTVTVKNDRADNGFLGQHFTTFSGFLLYQEYSLGPIVGK